MIIIAAVVCAAQASLTETPPPERPKIDKVLVLKSERKLMLLSGDKAVRAYKIALGGQPVGPKTRQGDHKTPEGYYLLDQRNAHSRFHKSLHVSYPNANDATNARKNGVDPGGDIMVHGLPNGFGWLGSTHTFSDWTDGCMAVTNAEMDEIWDLVKNGTPIEIRP